MEKETAEKALKKGSLSRRDMKLAGAGFTAFFLIMLSYYILKATRGGIFISAWGTEYIPHFLILNAIVSFTASALFGFLSDKLKPNQLIASILGFFCLNLLTFWGLFKVLSMNKTPGSSTLVVSGIYTLWIGFFSLFTVTPFWSVVTSVFKASSGKLLFGFIGIGGTMGAITGSKIVSLLASQIGSENLLLLSAFTLALVIPCVLYMYKSVEDDGDGIQKTLIDKDVPPDEAVKAEKTGKGALAGFFLISTRPYVRLIAAIVIISTFSIAIVDYKVQELVGSANLGKDQMTAFFAEVYFNVNLISIGTHIVTPIVLHILGMRAALSILPVVLLAGSSIIFKVESLEFISVIFAIILALHYSISQISKELLYVPCEEAIRYKAKSFIDTFGYRLGPVLSASLMLVTAKLGYPWLLLPALIIITVLWLYIISRVSKEFEKVADNTKNN
jgi:AAA family ATP:ADP antiporter